MGEAFGLALAASIYPPALLVVAAMLAGTPPLRRAMAYFAGAATATIGIGLGVVAALRRTDLVRPEHDRTVPASIEIALGFVLLVIGRRIAARPPAQPKAAQPVTEQRYLRIYGLGIAMYLPSVFYLGALNLVAEQDSGAAVVTMSVVALSAVVLLSIEIPIALYLRSPKSTAATLDGAKEWLHEHGRRLVAVLFSVGGCLMILSGVLKLR
jgi:hypothetical protein